MKAFFTVLFINLILFTLPLTAQTENSASAPFVTRFQGEVRNNLVRLSWLDSADARGSVFIFRSTLPFDASDLFQGSRPVEIPYGVQYFTDEIEIQGTYYYFAAASDETGRRYDIPISYTNTISVEILTDGPALTMQRPALPPVRTENHAPPGISSLEARAQGEEVIISFTSGQSGAGPAALYRSSRPITQTQDLLGAVIVQTRISSPYNDNPVPGIPYYYAVIAEDDLIRGTIEIIPGRNATLFPAEVSPGSFVRQDRDIRAIPLPQISVQKALPGRNSSDSPPPANLSSQAAKAIGNVPARQGSFPAQKKPRVFARDMETAVIGSEDHLLSTIIKGPFSSKNWEAAKNELSRFLALPRRPDTAYRARFYLGQCWYFLNNPREGLFEFLAIRERYPAESTEWIQASLELLTN